MKTARQLAKKLSIKYQILLTMIILCLFPFLGLLIYMIRDSVSVIQNQTLSREMEYLDKTRMQLESYKESAEAYFTSKAVEEVFFSYCYNDLNFRSYTMLQNAQNELKNFSYGQDILKGSYFINFDKSFIIGSTFAGSFYENDENYNPIQYTLQNAETTQTAVWTYIHPWEGFERLGKYPNLTLDGILLLISYPLFDPESHSAMIVSIDTDKLEQFLGRPEDAGQILIANEDKTIIYSSLKEEIGKNLSQCSYFSEISFDKKSGTIPIQDGNQKRSLCWIRDDSGWMYVSIMGMDLMNQKMRALWNTTLIFGGIALVILVLLIYLFSRRLYDPISSIANKMRHLTKDSREQNEFQLIKKGVDQYEEQMELYKNSLKEFFFQKLIKGNFDSTPPTKIMDEAQRTGLTSHGTDMVILVFQILELDQTSQNPDVSAAGKIFSFLPLDSVVTSTFYQGLLVVWIQNIPYSNQFIEKLQEDCRHIKQEMTLASYLFSLGISSIFHEYTDIHQAYLDAVSDLCVNRKDYGVSPSSSDWKHDFSPEELCAQLISSIQNGNEGETDHLLESIAKRIFQDTPDHDKQELFLIRTSASLFFHMQHKFPVSNELFPSHPLEMLLHIHDAKTMEYYFKKKIIRPLKEWMKDKTMEQQHNLSKSVISIIQEKFNTDITLELCADELHCHPMYLWQLFKEETNQTFSQYLENYRFYMAKKWLMETEKSVSEIADLLRYSNAQNFIRSFKKKTGMTPGKYRELNRCQQ